MQNAYIAYVRDQNSYSPENGFQISEISLNSAVKGHMVSLRQEQNPIMKFAFPFLKMFALCMLGRAQFLSDFYSVLRSSDLEL